jgi:hypothetical protein
LPNGGDRDAIIFIGPCRLIQHKLCLGFAMTGLAYAASAASKTIARDDGPAALVRWRLSDPTWAPSFAELLDDIRTCFRPEAEPALVLASLREAVKADIALAPRARLIAIEAQQLMAARA